MRNFKKVLALVLAVIFFTNGMSWDTIKSKAATTQYSGTDGDLAWSIDTDGHLLVEGTGSCSYQPKWLSYATKIKTATIKVKGITRTTFMLSGCTNLTSVDLSGLDTTNVTSMQNMFYNCSSLVELDLSNFNTSKVTNMASMFEDCSALVDVKLFSFNTRQVTDMFCMFEGCTNLKELDLGHFDTSNVTRMGNMFKGCASLSRLELSSNFVTNKVTSMSQMFDGCRSLREVDFSSFGTSNVTNDGVFALFRDCSSLTEINLGNFVPGNYIQSTQDMFRGCSNLKKINIGKLNTVAVQNMSYMFDGCSNLVEVGLSDLNTTNVKNMSHMFSNCSSLTQIDLSNFSTGNVTSMDSMFSGCSSLNVIDISNFDTSSVTTMSYMFCRCSNLKTLDLSEIDTTNVVNMSYMFVNCNGLKELDLSNVSTNNVTNMSGMFQQCSSLTELDLGSFYTTNVTKMGAMFAVCSSITDLDLSHFDTTNVTSMTSMFNECNNLKMLDICHFDTISVTSMDSMFSGCSNLVNLDLSSFDTSNVIDMSYMFDECSALQQLNLSSFDTTNVTDMTYMFHGCSGLKTVDLSSFNTTNVTYINDMFRGCRNLLELNLSNFDLGKAYSSPQIFDMCDSLLVLHTPVRWRYAITLPVNDCDPWKDEASKEYTVITKNQSESITLYRKGKTTDIIVKTMPDKTEYLLNEELDLTGMTFEAIYAGGQREIISSDSITIGQYDFSTVGTKQIMLTYGEASAVLSVEVVQEKTHAKLVGYTLSLKGDIVVNMQMKLSKELLSDETAHMKFIFPDGEVEKVNVVDAIPKEDNGLTYYVFACKVQAPEMNDEFKAQLITNLEDEVAYSYTYSVKEYADYILTHTSENQEYAKAAPMVRAMLNYGGYSQLQFKHNTDALANEGLYATNEDPVLTEDITLDDSYSFVAPNTDIGLRYYGSSLLLNAKTTIRHYFTITGNDDIADICEDYTFVLDDNTTLTPIMRGGMIYIDITGINAAELDDMFTLVVKNTETDKTISVTYSPFCYAKYVLENEIAGTNLVNVIKAMCLYNKAANNYYVANPHDTIKYNESYVSYDSFDDDNKEDNRIEELCFEDNTLCVSWTSWWSDTPGTAGTQTISYKGQTYYGGDGGGEPYSCRFTDNEIIISDYEGNTVYFTLVVQQNGELRVISSNLDEYRVGSVFVLKK